MAHAPPNIIERYVGDDWTVGPITLTAAGLPIDLTGATVSGLFYAREHLAPVAVLTETETPDVGGFIVAADRTTGVLTEAWVAAALTATVKPQDRRDAVYPTLLAILVKDSRGRERTYLKIFIRALDRGSAS